MLTQKLCFWLTQILFLQVRVASAHPQFYDGKMIASASEDLVIDIAEVETGKFHVF